MVFPLVVTGIARQSLEGNRVDFKLSLMRAKWGKMPSPRRKVIPVAKTSSTAELHDARSHWEVLLGILRNAEPDAEVTCPPAGNPLRSAIPR